MQLNQLTSLTIGLVLAYANLANAFWRMNCAVIQTGRVDPIVNPGTYAAHGHTIVGGSSKSTFTHIDRPSTNPTRYRSECDIPISIELRV